MFYFVWDKKKNDKVFYIVLINYDKDKMQKNIGGGGGFTLHATTETKSFA